MCEDNIHVSVMQKVSFSERAVDGAALRGGGTSRRAGPEESGVGVCELEEHNVF